MLIGDDLPKFGADLVPALPRLDVHDLTHGWKEEERCVWRGCCMPGLWWCVLGDGAKKNEMKSETGSECEIVEGQATTAPWHTPSHGHQYEAGQLLRGCCVSGLCARGVAEGQVFALH